MLGDCVVGEDLHGYAAVTWWDWAEAEVEAQRAAGVCARTPPTEVLTERGCAYEPRFEAIVEGDLALAVERISRPWEFADDYSLSFDYGADLTCGDWVEGASLFSVRHSETLVDDDDSPVPGAWVLGTRGGPYAYVRDGGLAGAHGWLCIDAYSGASTPEPGPAAASGSLYLHVEHWDDPEQAPADYFLTFDHNDCAGAEDASGEPIYSGDSYTGMYVWPACDGVDNDLDGEIDEFGVDADANGVSDCRECQAWEWADGCPTG